MRDHGPRGLNRAQRRTAKFNADAAGTYSECPTRRPHAHINIIAGESEGQSGCAAYVKRSHRASVNGAPTYTHTTYVQFQCRRPACVRRPRARVRAMPTDNSRVRTGVHSYVRTHACPGPGATPIRKRSARVGGLLLTWTRPLLPHRTLSAHGKGLVRGTCSALQCINVMETAADCC